MERTQRKQRLYKDLSWIFPILTPLEDYEEECRVFTKLIERYAKVPPETLLHLGCGGGHQDYYFKKRFTVSGVDISAPMLKLARRLNPECDYVRGDMRTVRLDRQFDAVTAGDALVYLLSEKDLEAVFRNAFRHLKPGGVFFVIPEHNREQFEQNGTGCVSRKSGKIDLTYVENRYDPDPTDSTFEIAYVYLIRRSGKLRVETDLHQGGLFAQGTWQRLLKKAGFTVTKTRLILSSFPRGCYLPLFVCVKPKRAVRSAR
jgi:ubiquinone/menaquinone biosynthesis C-methylase UbiE